MDDIRIGVGSSAITMRGVLYPFLCICAAIFVVFLEAALIINQHSFALCLAAGVIMTAEMVSQLSTLNPYDGKNCKGENL